MIEPALHVGLIGRGSSSCRPWIRSRSRRAAARPDAGPAAAGGRVGDGPGRLARGGHGVLVLAGIPLTAQLPPEVQSGRDAEGCGSQEVTPERVMLRIDPQRRAGRRSRPATPAGARRRRSATAPRTSPSRAHGAAAAGDRAGAAARRRGADGEQAARVARLQVAGARPPGPAHRSRAATDPGEVTTPAGRPLALADAGAERLRRQLGGGRSGPTVKVRAAPRAAGPLCLSRTSPRRCATPARRARRWSPRARALAATILERAREAGVPVHQDPGWPRRWRSSRSATRCRRRCGRPWRGARLGLRAAGGRLPQMGDSGDRVSTRYSLVRQSVSSLGVLR